MLILLHGKGSTANTSNTVKSIKSHPDLKDRLIFSPTYSWNGQDDYQSIKNFLTAYVDDIKSKYPDEFLVFCGISLGGFWAKHLANHYGGGCILINPAIEYYGQVEPDDPNVPMTIILGMNDDVINPNRTIELYNKRAAIIKTEDGHRIINGFDKIVEEIIFILDWFI